MLDDSDIRRSLAQIGVHSLVLKSADIDEPVSATRSTLSDNFAIPAANDRLLFLLNSD